MVREVVELAVWFEALGCVVKGTWFVRVPGSESWPEVEAPIAKFSA